MKLTKLQQEFIDEGVSAKGYIVFNIDTFKSNKYKEWKKNRRKSLLLK